MNSYFGAAFSKVELRKLQNSCFNLNITPKLLVGVKPFRENSYAQISVHAALEKCLEKHTTLWL
jgi:hypothetical protein